MRTIEAGAPAYVRGRQIAGAWSWRCALWGHAVDNAVFRTRPRGCVRCGRPCLQDDASVVRVGHTLSCFFRHHTYERVGTRDGHAEYACVQCGHPLLFPLDADPYAAASRFEKRVRYLCGLFGHHVHEVTTRAGGVEYACGCGHSFVQHPPGERRVTHPLRCFFLGHWIRFVERRTGLSEYACQTCGHPFLFSGSDNSQYPTPNSQMPNSQEETRVSRHQG